MCLNCYNNLLCVSYTQLSLHLFLSKILAYRNEFVSKTYDAFVTMKLILFLLHPVLTPGLQFKSNNLETGTWYPWIQKNLIVCRHLLCSVIVTSICRQPHTPHWVFFSSNYPNPLQPSYAEITWFLFPPKRLILFLLCVLISNCTHLPAFSRLSAVLTLPVTLHITRYEKRLALIVVPDLSLLKNKSTT